MAVNVTVITDLGRVGDRIIAAADAIRPRAETDIHFAALEAAPLARDIIKARTPVVTGDLAGSTDYEVDMDGPGARIHIKQPALAEDDFPYVYAVVGGRKAITAPSDGPWSHGALALKTPWGLRKSVKAAPPNPYPTEAEPELKTMLGTVLEHRGLELLASIVDTMK